MHEYIRHRQVGAGLVPAQLASGILCVAEARRYQGLACELCVINARVQRNDKKGLLPFIPHFFLQEQFVLQSPHFHRDDGAAAFPLNFE